MRLRICVLGAAVLVLAMLAGCAGGDALQSGGSEATAGSEVAGGGSEGAGGSDTIIVGSANFPEQLVLANMYADVIEDTGATVERRLNLGAREVIFPALRKGEINVLPEYNGALLAFLSKGEAKEKAPEEVTSALRDALPKGLEALEPAEAQDKDGLAVLPETAEEFSLATYSDLGKVSGELVAGGPAEMKKRDAGLPGLKREYNIEFNEFKPLDAGGPLTTEALQSGQIDVGRVFTTQGVIAENDWVLLEDDKELAPAQNIIPVAASDVLTPEITEALDKLSSTLTTEDLTAANKRVEIDKEDPDVVAREYLEEKGLIGG
ncbi:MAG: ABC transporter substrate-binding protein [Euzebyales bacterium]|nr:ABC transporter substrate-binding protein [Euzebyales bacterium]